MKPESTDSAAESKANPRRLLIVTTHPIQYQAPLWRRLACSGLVDVHVAFGCDAGARAYHDREFAVTVKWDIPLLEGYAHTILNPGSATNKLGRLRSAAPLRPLLETFRPDCALFNAYHPWLYWEALLLLNRRRIPVLLRHEATDVALPRGFRKGLMRDACLRWFYSRCARFLAIGTEARRHLSRLGVQEQKIFASPYCVDTDLMEEQIARFGAERERIRSSLGFDSSMCVYLFSGKLAGKKNPLLLAEALVRVPPELRTRIGLLVVGDGELRSKLFAALEPVLGRRAVFTGFVNQSEIGRYYAACDCLVLPSAWGETWGLVVNEAMHFGKPVIVSTAVGCHPDLVPDSTTGFVFQNGQASDLAPALTTMTKRLPQEAPAFASACRDRISTHSLDIAVQGILDSVFSLSEKSW